MIYAVDFDGLLCEDAYPEIGAPKTEIIEHFKALKAQGHKLILWTCREGQALRDAINWCMEQGLHFDAYNSNLPEMNALYGNDCRKVGADFYCDDRNYTPQESVVKGVMCDAKEEDIELNEIVDGIDRDRLREICAAERDGRCVVLPCKVGEIVYVPTSQVCDDCIISGVIQYFVVYETFADAAAIFNQGASDAFIARVKTENIGKTVFLTREEAEGALQKEAQHE